MTPSIDLVCEVRPQLLVLGTKQLPGRTVELLDQNSPAGRAGYVDWTFSEPFAAKLALSDSNFGIVVGSKYKKQGVGKFLLERLIPELVEDGYHKFIIDEALPSVIGFYNKTLTQLMEQQKIVSFEHYPLYINHYTYGYYEMQLPKFF